MVVVVCMSVHLFVMNVLWLNGKSQNVSDGTIG